MGKIGSGGWLSGWSDVTTATDCPATADITVNILLRHASLDGMDWIESPRRKYDPCFSCLFPGPTVSPIMQWQAVQEMCSAGMAVQVWHAGSSAVQWCRWHGRQAGRCVAACGRCRVCMQWQVQVQRHAVQAGACRHAVQAGSGSELKWEGQRGRCGWGSGDSSRW